MQPHRALAVAHRGDPYRHRENTLPSLRSAQRAGADVVEIDVRVTADGVPVLLHDATLHRLWGVDRPVAAATCAEVRRLGLPTLSEALDALEARVMIDLSDPVTARAAVAEARLRGAGRRVYYCGALSALAAVRAEDADAEIALTWKRTAPPPPALLRDLRPAWINMPFGLVDRALVERVHEEGRRVGVWTVDAPPTMALMLRLGVDAVTTNRIGALLRLLARRSPGRFRRGRSGGDGMG
ncbi:glycerophosphodiester phosphodiesterase [Streptomyces capparidis]